MHPHSEGRIVFSIVCVFMCLFTSVPEQWRTEERVRGLEPLPLAYDLRNKRQKASKYGIFNKKYEKFSGEGAHDPSHSKILGTPLCP